MSSTNRDVVRALSQQLREMQDALRYWGDRALAVEDAVREAGCAARVEVYLPKQFASVVRITPYSEDE